MESRADRVELPKVDGEGALHRRPEGRNKLVVEIGPHPWSDASDQKRRSGRTSSTETPCRRLERSDHQRRSSWFDGEPAVMTASRDDPLELADREMTGG